MSSKYTTGRHVNDRGLSEREKMLSGKPYLAVSDPQLVKERLRVRPLLQKYNSYPWPANEADDPEPDYFGPDDRRLVLAELFGLQLDDIKNKPIEIEPPFFCDYGHNIVFNGPFYCNFNCHVLDCATVTFGSRVICGPNVQIYAGTHSTDVNERKKGLERAYPVSVGDDVWIGGGAIVIGPSKIGNGSTIAAGAVVRGDVPANVVVGGVPARLIKDLGAKSSSRGQHSAASASRPNASTSSNFPSAAPDGWGKSSAGAGEVDRSQRANRPTASPSSKPSLATASGGWGWGSSPQSNPAPAVASDSRSKTGVGKGDRGQSSGRPNAAPSSHAAPAAASDNGGRSGAGKADRGQPGSLPSAEAINPATECFLANIPTGLENSTLQDALSVFGEVRSLTLDRSRRLGFVRFDTSSAAEEAVRAGRSPDGLVVSVNEDTKERMVVGIERRRVSVSSRAFNPDLITSTKCLIRRVPVTVDCDDLRALIERRAGKLIDWSVQDFNSPDPAKQTDDKFVSMEFEQLCGARDAVRLSQPINGEAGGLEVPGMEGVKVRIEGKKQFSPYSIRGSFKGLGGSTHHHYGFRGFSRGAYHSNRNFGSSDSKWRTRRNHMGESISAQE